MAATAGSVAVGSTIGHGLSNMLFGGSSHAPEAAPAAPAPPVQQQSYQGQGVTCEAQAKGASKFCHQRFEAGLLTCFPAEFTKCLDKADLPSCTWYLEQLKAVSRLLFREGFPQS